MTRLTRPGFNTAPREFHVCSSSKYSAFSQFPPLIHQFFQCTMCIVGFIHYQDYGNSPLTNKVYDLIWSGIPYILINHQYFVGIGPRSITWGLLFQFVYKIYDRVTLEAIVFVNGDVVLDCCSLFYYELCFLEFSLVCF